MRPTSSPFPTCRSKALRAVSPSNDMLRFLICNIGSLGENLTSWPQEAKLAASHQPGGPPQHQGDQEERVDHQAPLLKPDDPQEFGQNRQTARGDPRPREAPHSPCIKKDEVGDPLEKTQDIQ